MFMKKKFILGVLYFSAATAQGQRPGGITFVSDTSKQFVGDLVTEAREGATAITGDAGGELVDLSDSLSAQDATPGRYVTAVDVL